MLGASLWFALMFALLAASLTEGAAAFARATAVAAAEHAVEPALHDALAAYQLRLAGALGADSRVAVLAAPAAFAGTPDSLMGTYAQAQTLIGTTAATGSAGPFAVETSVAPTTVAPADCSAPGGGGDAIAWLQCSGFVQESRMSLQITVRVRDAAGTELVRRMAFVSLRLFATPPYSAVVGRSDAAADDPLDADPSRDPAHEGDTGGATVSGAAISPSSAFPAGGTLIHVRYRCIPAGPSCDNSSPSDPDASIKSGAMWSNGNRPGS